MLKRSYYRLFTYFATTHDRVRFEAEDAVARTWLRFSIHLADIERQDISVDYTEGWLWTALHFEVLRSLDIIRRGRSFYTELTDHIPYEDLIFIFDRAEFVKVLGQMHPDWRDALMVYVANINLYDYNPDSRVRDRSIKSGTPGEPREDSHEQLGIPRRTYLYRVAKAKEFLRNRLPGIIEYLREL